MRITLDAIFKPKMPGNPHWSPDGRWLAFSLSEILPGQNTAFTSLWLLSADGKKRIPLTRGRAPDGRPVTDSSPCWSPDGEFIAFYSNRSGPFHLWAIRPFGGEAFPITTDSCGCGPIMTDAFFAGMDWSPDSSHLAFVAQLPEKKSLSDARVTSVNYGETYANVRTRIHVWTIPVRSSETDPGAAAPPKARQITRGDFHHGDPRWSPDGQWIAFVSNRSRDEEAVIWSINKNYDLWLAPSRGGSAERLTSNPGPDISPRWSPDGRSLAYLSCPRCGSHADVFQLRVLDLKTRRPALLTADLDHSVDRLSPQCWTSDGRAIWFSAAVRTGNRLFQALALEGGWRGATRGNPFLMMPAVAPRGRLLACISQNDRSLSEIQIRRQPGASVVEFTTQWNRWVQRYRLGTTRVLRWKSDSYIIEGVLVLPPGFRPGRRYPAIVLPHGGPHGRSTTALNLVWQWLAAQGFVLLAPNFRGTVGYGQAFVDADRADFGGGDFRDLMRGLDQIIARGLADPGRLGILGASYGGFMTTWTIGQTSRFKAAVALCPVTNLHSMFGTTDIKSWTRWEFRGYPWEKFEDYVRCSPITYASSVKTPTLLLHGENDLRVPISQSEEFFSALRACGVTAQFVRYPDEGHGISQPHHVRDYLSRTLQWFQRYLAPTVRGRRL